MENEGQEGRSSKSSNEMLKAEVEAKDKEIQASQAAIQ
jgi:hypothetical protein